MLATASIDLRIDVVYEGSLYCHSTATPPKRATMEAARFGEIVVSDGTQVKNHQVPNIDR